MNQSLTERVQAASNFVINAFIPGSENHQALLNIFFILALFFLLLAITNRFWLAFILNNLVFIILVLPITRNFFIEMNRFCHLTCLN
ncbi:hypothetical protein Q757_07175 [Oenococcus alcoholitolerans]|uniref:Uncharacterized protein n=1 Tax=Oenococcus alcoholitolerans TaxID=931074 RepID=A0ABR4XPR4_9LACO|nr:hypothetical protein Q757_07175 [Oenococcus alcoholitolerans]